MTPFRAHIINHTHWDREWFLTSIYTSRWIPGLIDRLAALAEQNPDFHFFLDGQTLVIEDLLLLRPDYLGKVEQLVRNGNLQIGPYYCQPDWRLASGEALLRNLLFGYHDTLRFGGKIETGWLVDTFGHSSQAPQLHRLFGIDAVYIWRGAPQMLPYFNWFSAEGSGILAINLFGGYRNLYGVTHTPEIAAKRLAAEIAKLAPYYPTPDIPLFDGYDLEDNPEDPVRFFRERSNSCPVEIEIHEATPASFAQEINQQHLDHPAIPGELISGKYGAVFPGTLSTRIYLKRMARDCESLLYQVCEPLAVLARLKGREYPSESYEAWCRMLLQNAVHDCICGVSIDQVHEKMEVSYRQVFDALQQDMKTSIEAILEDFSPGMYAISTSPFAYQGWRAANGKLYPVTTGGVGVWKAGEPLPIHEGHRPVASFTWKNDYYEAEIRPDGTEPIGYATLGAIRVYAERGDAYSVETGPFLGSLRDDSPFHIVQESEQHCVLEIHSSASFQNLEVSAILRLTFDRSPFIRWEVSLDGRGVDYQLEMAFETAQAGEVIAGMPFDIVRRDRAERDLLPRELDDRLAAVLLGQRELEETTTFPFQDFVAITDGSQGAAVFAQGLHAYQADDQGCLTITLSRPVELLTRPDLEHRVGDAGPFFYVPDARGEREVTHELAFFMGGPSFLEEVLSWNAAFQNPPLLVEAQTAGNLSEWRFFQEDLPLSSLQISGNQILARLYNPTGSECKLSKAYQQVDVFGNPLGPLQTVPAKSIANLLLGEVDAAPRESSGDRCVLLTPPAWHVGENQRLPDPVILELLREKIEQLKARLAEVEAMLPLAKGQDRYMVQHQVYVLQRELLEYRLSTRLNEIKLEMQGQLTHAYLYEPDEEIAALGKELNQLRIKRRIYDYVIQAVKASEG